MTVTALSSLQLGVSFPLLALTLDDWGVSEAGIGLFTLAAAISTILAAPVVPRILSKIGVRTALAAACLTVALCALAHFLVRDLAVWFALRMATGFAFGVVFIAGEAWILDRVQERRRGLFLGLYATCLAGGLSLGATAVGFFGHASPWAYASYGALGLLGACAVLLPGPGLSAPDQEGARARALLSRIGVAPLTMLAPLAMGAIETAKYNLLPVYGRRVGLPDDASAYLVTAAGLGVLCCQLPLGALADRIGAGRVLVGCAMFGAAAPAAIWAAGDNPMAAYAAVFAFSGIVTGLYTIGLIRLARAFAGPALAAANAAYGLSYGVGQLIGPAVAGAAFTAFGTAGFLAALGVFSGGYALASLFLRDRPLAH